MEKRICVYLTAQEIDDMEFACFTKKMEARKAFITDTEYMSPANLDIFEHWHKEYEHWKKAEESLKIQETWNHQTDEEKQENSRKYIAIEEKQKEQDRYLTEQCPGQYPAEDDKDFLEAVKKLEAIKQNVGGAAPRKGNTNEDNDDH